MKQKGFTLIELLVVIAIVGILSSVVLASLNSARTRSKATRVIQDLRSIETAWNLWLSDTNSPYIHEDNFGTTNSEWACTDEVPLTDTDLFSDTQSLPGWNGPYLQSATNPFGHTYTYDNDQDVYPAVSSGGVNIFLPWCGNSNRAQYMEIADDLDEAFDGGDGGSTGRVRWSDATNGSIMFLLDSNN